MLLNSININELSHNQFSTLDESKQQSSQNVQSLILNNTNLNLQCENLQSHISGRQQKTAQEVRDDIIQELVKSYMQDSRYNESIRQLNHQLNILNILSKNKNLQILGNELTSEEKYKVLSSHLVNYYTENLFKGSIDTNPLLSLLVKYQNSNSCGNYEMQSLLNNYETANSQSNLTNYQSASYVEEVKLLTAYSKLMQNAIYNNNMGPQSNCKFYS